MRDEEALIRAVYRARKRAYTPYPGFQAEATLLGRTGRQYFEHCAILKSMIEYSGGK